MHHVDAERLRGGQQHREDHEDDRRSFEEAAEDQQQHVDHQQEHKRRQLVGLQRRAQRLRDVLRRDDEIEHHRAGDQHADGHRDARTGHQRMVDVRPSQVAVQKCGEQQRVGSGNRSGFGGRGDPAPHAPEQDHRHHERRQRVPGHARQLAQRNGLLDREVATPRHEGNQAALEDTEQQAGNHATEEKVADRRVRNQRIDHQGDRRRDDRPDDRRYTGECGGECRRVLVILGHQRLHQLARGGRVGERGTRHAREDDCLQDVHLREPTAEAADNRVAEAQQPVQDAASAHERSGEDEQRNGKQQLA